MAEEAQHRQSSQRTGWLIVLGSLGVVAVVVIALAVGLRDNVGHKDASPTAQHDDFHRSDRNLDGDRAPSGARYSIQFDPGNTGLVIRNHRLVRGNQANYGPNGAPILIVPNATVPAAVGVRYVFTTGKTKFQDVVVGACKVGFGSGSVQFVVAPTFWRLFYVAAKPNAAGKRIMTLKRGSFSKPLATDGRTEYTTVMRVDINLSSVTVTYPGGTLDYADPVISQYWGKLMGVQIRDAHPTDGDAQIIGVASGPYPLTVPR